MSSCTVNGECGIRNEYIPTIDVFTPYAYPVLSDTASDKSSLEKQNYDEYDLFCLRTRLSPHIKRLGLKIAGVDSWGIRFEPLLYNTVMRISVVIYNGDIFVPITSDFHQELQDLVNSICGDKYTEDGDNIKDYCLLIHSEFSIPYENSIIDKVWLESVLSYLPFPTTVIYSQTQDKVHEYDSLYVFPAEGELSGLYVKLERKLLYNNAYHRLYMQVLDIIYDFYIRGTIILDPDADSTFIQLWGLTQNRIIHSESRFRMYHPGWVNRWIAPNPTKFILDRRSGIPYIVFSLSNSTSTKHGVAIKLKKHAFRFTFSSNEVLVWVRNIVRADLAHNCIMSGISYVKGEVITDVDTRLPPSIESNTIKYRDLKYGIVTSMIV